jgi:hypothetical protein
MLRRLLNTTSIACIVACVVLTGMWVRSYRWLDQLQGRVLGRQVVIDLIPGRLLFVEHGLGASLDRPWSIESYPVADRSTLADLQGLPKPFLGFSATLASNHSILMVPYWFLVFTSGSLAMDFRGQRLWGFKLRSLFIVTTFLAAVLGMSAWLDHFWIGR